MINAGQDFANAVSQTSRHFRIRMFHGSNEIAGNIRSAKIHLGSTGPEAFSIGAVFSSYAEIVLDGRETSLEGKELRIDVGILTDPSTDTYADMTLGYFTALAPAATKYRTTFTSVGRITSKLAETAFIPPETQTIKAVAASIQTATGVTIEFETGIDTTGLIEHPITGNCRDALSVLAGVVFGYATETNTGTVKISRFSCTATASYNASRMTTLPAITDNNFEITGVQAITETGTFETGSPVNVSVENNYVTEDLFEAFAPGLIGIAYRPGNVQLALGDPRIEPSDSLQITVDEDTYIVPCFSITHTFDGGLQTEIITPAEQAIGKVVGTMTKAVQEATATAQAAAAQASDARKVATNYLSRDETGIMVADLNDGNQTPSTATGNNVFVDNQAVKVREGQKDLATYAGTGITFDEGTPYKIGNAYTYIDYIDTDEDQEADTLRIVADSVSFRSGADVQDELNRLSGTVEGVQQETDSLRADTEDSINALSGAIEQQNEAISAAQENTNQVRRFININPAVPSISVGTNDNTYVDIQAGRMAFVADGNEAASVGSSDMKIPTVTTKTLNMQATDPATGNIIGEMFWVMRSNGHLSLKMSG